MRDTISSAGSRSIREQTAAAQEDLHSIIKGLEQIEEHFAIETPWQTAADIAERLSLWAGNMGVVSPINELSLEDRLSAASETHDHIIEQLDDIHEAVSDCKLSQLACSTMYANTRVYQ
jgi:hypothetical protein